MSDDDRAMNDRLKLKPAKRGKKNIRASAAAKKTQQITDEAQLAAQKGTP